MNATTQERRKTIVAPFAIEISDKHNSDQSLNVLPGCRLRGRIEYRPGMSIDYQKALAGCPAVIPGQQLKVFPERKKWRISDPLCDDPALCRQIRDYIVKRRKMKLDEIRGVDATEGEIDVHRMKTLCRKMLQIVEHGSAFVVDGPTPTMEEIDSLPGRYLANASAVTRWSMPVYEDEMESWVASLARGSL